MITFEAEERFMPEAKTSFSAGLDIKATENKRIEPGKTVLLGTGVKISHCPTYVYLDLELRSSMRVKGLSSLGTGVIDSDYRDEIKVVIHNASEYCQEIKEGDRIAQLIPRENITYRECKPYVRGSERSGGFGSTGK